MRALLLALAAGLFFNDVLLALGQGLFWWSGAIFLGSLFTPILVSAFYGLWQAVIPADLQGRVFAARDIWVDLPYLLGALLAGPLADVVFEPALLSGGKLAGLGGLFGNTAGSGIAFMFVLFGGVGVLLALAGFKLKALQTLDE